MTLSRRGDYVIRAAVYLASRVADPASVTLDEVSERMSIPRSYAPRIMGALVATGLATSRAGRTGGYRLARDPSEISVLEVIEVGEGGIGLARCPLRGVPCHWGEHCAVHPTMWNATEAIRDTLRSTSLADLADEEVRLVGGTNKPGSSAQQSGRMLRGSCQPDSARY